ncbi:hypothetical protein PVAND_014315 [Polypedilum vanderplanki]|uniref:Uncharacterized protein n=1 Tax=Polypedilum vanderplanki TaxID=319348 RepID=A0A9J6CT66_POLVA|nr:hypothetical protein PVAND_014315 [Polypedilum vanderplanki]
MSAPYPTGDQSGYPSYANPYSGQPNIGFAGPQPTYPPQGFQQPYGYQGPSQPTYYPPSQPHYDPNKPANPPYMDNDDPNYNASGMGFDDKSIRAGFIRRVYSILSIQLLVTLGFVMLFVFHEPTKLFAHRNPQLMMIPMIGTLVLVCVIACFESARRNSPTNIILLGLFTFFESTLVGFISSTYETKIVLMAIGLTTIIVIGLTLFAFQTKYDFTMCGGFLCICLLILTIGSLIGAFFFRGELGQFIIACAGAAIFSMYIVYDTQIMMGGEHKYSISPEEYIFAALNLYMDIIQLFLYLLRILKYLNND